MRFDSAEFLFFFLIVVVLHRTLPWKRGLLLLASWLFYASWNPPFLLLLLGSTVLDFEVGRRLDRTDSPRRRRALLAASMTGNLGALAFFKYFNFFLSQLVHLGASSAALAAWRIDTAIPLGISFYTFQTLGYAIDVYRRKTPACQRFGEFALFVAFFPQLIAGPIIRAAEFIPQIRRDARPSAEQTLEGLELCIEGLFKKVVIADSFASLVDRCFAYPSLYSGPALLVAGFSFSAQIYCDFSGYSTMARGLAKLFGYELPENFRYPLLAGNPVDYRRSWHITMGNWFRDYLYVPLGGDRHGLARTLANTILVWTAFGLWHGASWTFVLWGLYNGVLLAGWRLLRHVGVLPLRNRAAGLAGYLVMPFFVGLSNIVFRAQSLEDAKQILSRIAGKAPGLGIHPGWAVALVALFALHWASKLWWSEPKLQGMGWPARIAFVSGSTLLLLLLAQDGQPFYYFQF